MKKRSFQLIRTNPRLTTNMKFVVSSNDNLYMESFNSCSALSNDKYKHYLLKTNSSIENDFSKFYDGLSKTIAFTPYSFNDISTMYQRYENQIDEMYFSGADEIEDTWYSEEYEYFAPLYVVKNSLPSNFIIMRVDDPAIYVKTGDDYKIDNLRKDNFKSEIIDKWKLISNYDLSTNTNIGKFLNRNINENNRFPTYSFYFDAKKNNFSSFAGMRYTDGIYSTAEMFLNDKLESQKTHFDLEEFVTKGFETNNIVYPFIFNLKFLFDDAPATQDTYKNYSMNRYYGFYTNSLEKIKTITTYELPKLKIGLIIKNNIFVDNDNLYVNPFINSTENNNWIKYNNDFYEVRKQNNSSYKIISDTDLSGINTNLFNDGIVTITNNNITDFGNTDAYINSNGNNEEMYADLYLIEIDGKFHVLKNNYTKTIINDITTFNNNYYIQCDYNINSNNDVLEYYKGGKLMTNNYSQNIYDETGDLIEFSDVLSNINAYKDIKTIDGEYNTKTILQNNKPIYYNIYRVNFCDIKDFDFNRINTNYSDFDYEKSTYVSTLEDKLYTTEYRDKTLPKKNRLNRFNEDGQYKIMNVSSEYIADSELYEIYNHNLNTSMWDKTQTINKWEYRDSVSHSDYPYKLNNSTTVGGAYNRTVNTAIKTSNLIQKNLDYFYRINEFYGKQDLPIVEDVLLLNYWNISGNSICFHTTGNTLIYDYSLDNSKTSSIIELNNYNFEINSEYYFRIDVDLKNGNIISGNTFNIGFYEDFLDKSVNVKMNDIFTLSFIGKPKTSRLKIIIDNYTYVKFSNLKIYKIENKYYYNQSTNIQTSLYEHDDSLTDNRFNLNYYIDSNIDYFDYFFHNTMYYENYGKNYKKSFYKYATFNGGTSTLPAKALFKGIGYELYNVTDMVLENVSGIKEKISTVTTNGGIDYNGYKMSVILSENYNYYKFQPDRIDANDSDNFNTWIYKGLTSENDDEYIRESFSFVKPDIGIFELTWDTHELDGYPVVSGVVPGTTNNDGEITITIIE